MTTFKSLTKKEKKHLKEVAGVSTLAAFKETAAAHVEMRKKSTLEPCYACKAIAVKLGLDV